MKTTAIHAITRAYARIRLTQTSAQHNLWGRAKHSESFWTVEDGELHITLTKLDKATPWDAALAGHEPLDPLTATEVLFLLSPYIHSLTRTYARTHARYMGFT